MPRTLDSHQTVFRRLAQRKYAQWPAYESTPLYGRTSLAGPESDIRTASDVWFNHDYCLLELPVVDVNLQANVEGLDASVMFQAVLDELVNLSRTEPRKSTDFVNDHEIEPSRLDVIKELVVHLASVGVGGAGDDL